jgi:hypothetical protein
MVNTHRDFFELVLAAHTMQAAIRGNRRLRLTAAILRADSAGGDQGMVALLISST